MPSQQYIAPYKYGFSEPERYVFKSDKGLTIRLIEEISHQKKEPSWMRDLRLRSFAYFNKQQLPVWGGDLSGIKFDNIHYYIKPTNRMVTSWDQLPIEIRRTYDRIGIPEAEKKMLLGGVSAQYESNVVYKSIKTNLSKKGVIFLDMDSGLRRYPELVKQYFGTIVPSTDNKFAALNSASWSGGSFIYVPKGVKVELPLQAYFRINAANMGQFERTLIIADEGSFVHYVEGCFPQKTLITTKEGYKTIENINIGTYVLTHFGNYKRVTHTQLRQYTGYLYEIDYYGDTTAKLRATTEHPFLISKRKVKNERNKKFPLQWIEVSKLNKKDYLTLPIINKVNKSPFYVFEIFKGAGRHKKKKIKIKIENISDFFRLIGYYLAEGSISNGYYVNFSFSNKEQNYINDVKRLIKKIFQTDQFHESVHKKNHGISLVVHSVEIARIFQNFGTSSSTKILPTKMIFEEPKRQKEIILGLYRGDGNYFNRLNKHGRKEIFRISTTSRNLARQVRDILFRLGIVSFLNKRIRIKEKRQDIFTVGIAGEFMVPFGKLVGIKVNSKINNHKRATLFAIDGKYAYFPIKKIKKKYVEKYPVYNLRVEKAESYVALGVNVHNCTAPIYSTDSLHSAVVEIIVKKGARVRYTTIQNWSTNVYNLVTKRMRIEEEGVGEWVDVNLGSKLTMKYPSCYLVGRKAHGEILSIAYAHRGQHQDAGGKVFHAASETTSRIISKSISGGSGRTSYRGLLYVAPTAAFCKSKVVCDALILDSDSRSDTYPTMRVSGENAHVEHEATVTKIGEEQLFYLMSRGITKELAESLMINGFIEPIVKELPLEYAVEMNRLIQLQMEGSMG